MNVLEIINTVRDLNAELLVEDDKLVIRGTGERLPDDLRAAIQENKPEILAALGLPSDRILLSILGEIRHNLPPSLASMPDSHLLILINVTILHAFTKAVREFRSDR